MKLHWHTQTIDYEALPPRTWRGRWVMFEDSAFYTLMALGTGPLWSVVRELMKNF